MLTAAIPPRMTIRIMPKTGTFAVSTATIRRTTPPPIRVLALEEAGRADQEGRRNGRYVARCAPSCLAPTSADRSTAMAGRCSDTLISLLRGHVRRTVSTELGDRS